MPIEYNNTKIFKIVSENTPDIYYGETVNPLSKRRALLNSDYKLYKQGKKKYIPPFDLFDKGSIKFILVESYPCKSRDEALARLHHYVTSNECINNRKEPVKEDIKSE